MNASRNNGKKGATAKSQKSSKQPQKTIKSKAGGKSLFERFTQVARRGVRRAEVERQQERFGQREQVERVGYESLVDERRGDFVAEPLDVQRVARGEVREARDELRGAEEIRAADGDFALGARNGRAADRTRLRHAEFDLRAGALLRQDGDDRGDDFARLLDQDVVADADVLSADVVLVVQRRAGDVRAGERDGAQLRDGREDAGAADLHRDRLDDRLGALRLVLERARPARRLGGGTERRVKRTVVDFDHRAVHLERERMAQFFELVDRAVDFVHPAAGPRARLHGEAERPQALRERPVRGGVRLAAQRADAVQDRGERARGDFAGVEQLERAGGGVARVFERLLAAGGLLAHEVEEAALGHVDFAARFERLRVARDAQRQGADRARAGGHVVADLAVAAGGRDGEDASLVRRAEREAVDLGLDDVVDRLAPGDRADHRVEVRELRAVVGVLQRLHRDRVGDFLEAVERRAADALRGRIGRAQLRVRVLQVAQLAHHRVELAVGDFGRGVAVVEHGVAREFRAEERRARGRGGVRRRGGLAEQVVGHAGDSNTKTRPRHAEKSG